MFSSLVILGSRRSGLQVSIICQKQQLINVAFASVNLSVLPRNSLKLKETINMTNKYIIDWIGLFKILSTYSEVVLFCKSRNDLIHERFLNQLNLVDDKI